MTMFYIGLAVGGVVELLGRMSQMDDEESGEPEDGQTYSISNGTIMKSLLGFGLIEWIFRRKK